MMKEVEAGNVEYLCIKDMSRMGRDYLKVGQIMEILRQRGVRLIAINDGVDSARGDDDFTPFRNIMNEYYARDTSRKIRSTFQSKGKSGKDPEKTESGKYISAYECDPATVADEFLLAKASYAAMTSREQKKENNVLCYQIRQCSIGLD